MATFSEAVTVNGAVTANQFNGPLGALSNIPVRANAAYPIPLTSFRVWDAFQTNLPGSASSDDMGLATGTFATGLPYLTSSTVRNVTIVAQYARTIYKLPPEYVAGASAILRFAAGALTTVAGTSLTLDCEAYKSSRDTLKTGSDLVSTSATSINSLTFANTDFVLTTTGLVAGDWLDIRITFAGVDAANTGAIFAAIAVAELVVTTQG